LEQFEDVGLLLNLARDVLPVFLKHFKLLILSRGLIFHNLLTEHFEHLDNLFFDHFPDLNKLIHFIERKISPIDNIFFEELDEGTGEDLLDLVDVVLGFGLDLLEVADDFEVVLGLGGLVGLLLCGDADEFAHVDFELFPLFFHFVEALLVDKLAGGDVGDFDEFFLHFLYLSEFELLEGDFVAEDVSKSGQFFDGMPVSFP
jgi:hypothetical protein